MPKLTVQLSDEILKALRNTASSEGLAPRQWVAQLVAEKLAELHAGDPGSEAFSTLAGAWSDMPSLEEISSAYRQESSSK